MVFLFTGMVLCFDVFHSVVHSYPLAFYIAVCQYIDMICINCFHTKTTVINSRPHKTSSGTWRRRHCPHCKQLFTTYERPSMQDTAILGPTGAKTPFSLSKLCLSIAGALEHDKPARVLYSLDLAETVEQLLLRDIKQPSTADIAALTHQVLKRFDELAALQYAARHELLYAVRRRGRPSIASS